MPQRQPKVLLLYQKYKGVKLALMILKSILFFVEFAIAIFIQSETKWKNAIYPVVPGHEIVGKAVKIGKEVKNFKVGDFVAVGCMVDSCRTCQSCKEDLEQYCEKETILTYNSPISKVEKQNYWTIHLNCCRR